jgi:hypothetical protein
LNHPTPSLSEPWGSYLIRLNKGGRGMLVQYKRRLAKRYLVTAVLWPQGVVKPEANVVNSSINTAVYVPHYFIYCAIHLVTVHTSHYTHLKGCFHNTASKTETTGIFKQRYRTCQDTKMVKYCHHFTTFLPV